MFVVAGSKDTSFSHLSLGHGMKMFSSSIPSFLCTVPAIYVAANNGSHFSFRENRFYFISLNFFHDCAEVPWFRCL